MDDLKVVHRSASEKDPWRNIPETKEKQNIQKHSDDKAMKSSLFTASSDSQHRQRCPIFAQVQATCTR